MTGVISPADEAIAMLDRLRDFPFMVLETGETIGLPDGFIPRLVAYTVEDKAAKGLRSLRERLGEPEPPVHFSALEVIQENRCTLLTALPGGGKTALARNLALNLAGEITRDSAFGHRRLGVSVARNDRGTVKADCWSAGTVVPVLAEACPGMTFAQALGDRVPGETQRLVIIDGIERIGSGWAAFAREIEGVLAGNPRLRVLLLGETGTLSTWSIPPGITRHELLPLLVSQRRQFEADVLSGRGLSLCEASLSDAAAHPAIFGLSQRVRHKAEETEDIIDGWSDAAAVKDHDVFRESRFLSDLLAARTLAPEPVSKAATLFCEDPERWEPVLASLLKRLAREPQRLMDLVDLLMKQRGNAGLHGALMAAGMLDLLPEAKPRIIANLCRMIDGGKLSPHKRAAAGRVLAVHGDPRDLELLVEVPGGAFIMGSATHPNSVPAHGVSVGPFAIGAYPVTNARFLHFTEQTGRPWVSPDRRRPDRRNAPATDLTWHDAQAFCSWLTMEWRKEGRIAADAKVRLPTEPEWEYAARGTQPDAGDAIVYPWMGGWSDDCANAEPTGFNDTCTVGLFPKGRSPFGCYDMAGQVWEWCTTLWGDNMAMPSFAYPYGSDGRENLQAPDTVRRVLRGGCFSSGPPKACATYRGSLEANGFWRGNGFRIVVSTMAKLSA